MKKKKIILILIGIIIISVGLILIVKQNSKKAIMQDGVMLALSLDGKSIAEFPSSTNYRVEIDCKNGRGKVLPEDGTWKFSVDNIIGNISCYIDFYSRTENDKLINTVENASEIVNKGDAGSRYEGPNPDNYIWFNNEMWRIIGSIPTKVDSSGTTTNLVKIIRKDSLGSITYDAKSSGSTGEWGNNTLYTLLNEYYYSKKDGTNTDYCRYVKCDYRVNGISSASTDYHGKMVKNVYWNTGASDSNVTASAAYINEKTKQTVQGRIGLMSASDYGYAIPSSIFTSLGNHSANNAETKNWLYVQGDEQTNTQEMSDTSKVLAVSNNGDVNGFPSKNWSMLFRPVVYLNENVYVLTGSGTEENPYIIGM